MDTAADTEGRAKLVRWPSVVCFCASFYYLTSAVTLPFVNKLWIGELAPLALFQLPKSVLKSAIHPLLMWLVRTCGWSSGSFSPDYIATHPWAMGLMAVLPVLCLTLILLLVGSWRHRRFWISAMIVCALLDGVATFCFDSGSSLKLYNAVYF